MAMIHSTKIITSGLTLCLDAGNRKSYSGSGTSWVNLIDRNSSGSLVNSPTFSNNNSGYFSFDGSNGYCTLPSTGIVAGNELSFCVWNFGISVSRTIVWFQNSSGERILNVHLPWADGTIYFDAGAGVGTFDRIGKSAGTEYQGWNYWVFTKNATTGTMKIYRNGVEWHAGTGFTRVIENPSGQGYLALLPASGGGPLYHNGYIAEVKLYNIELSDQQIKQNFNATRRRFGI